eukprot:2680164-Prymnesium_polylepis.1
MRPHVLGEKRKATFGFRTPKHTKTWRMFWGVRSGKATFGLSFLVEYQDDRASAPRYTCTRHRSTVAPLAQTSLVCSCLGWRPVCGLRSCSQLVLAAATDASASSARASRKRLRSSKWQSCAQTCSPPPRQLTSTTPSYHRSEIGALAT